MHAPQLHSDITVRQLRGLILAYCKTYNLYYSSNCKFFLPLPVYVIHNNYARYKKKTTIVWGRMLFLVSHVFSLSLFSVFLNVFNVALAVVVLSCSPHKYKI